MEALSINGVHHIQNEAIARTVRRERRRLLTFIQHRIPEREEAEDILQDVFYQLTEAYRHISIERVTSWLFTVARNKITDRYRRKKPERFKFGLAYREGEEQLLGLEDLLPDFSAGPDSALMRATIWKAIEDALDELPKAQRKVFVMHEFEDMSFKEISAMTRTPVNTLLSRKRYAVLHLRKRLQALYEELKES